MSGRTLPHLEQRFPDRETQIARLARVNPDFHDLCRDYEDCARVLEDISRNPVPVLERVKEYRELKLALELEIREFLERPSGRVSVFHDDHH
ncbi:MAG: hypothetical protein QNL12_15975 [Acidimicrobiia bacterium]|nr:hypothetical protein [Acidimicrobiia bacterium]MDX2468810.1 hypothetical protein [Acidimicrobiia bacterium]